MLTANAGNVTADQCGNKRLADSLMSNFSQYKSLGHEQSTERVQNTSGLKTHALYTLQFHDAFELKTIPTTELPPKHTVLNKPTATACPLL